MKMLWERDSVVFAGMLAPLVSMRCAPWTGFVETLVTVLVPFNGCVAPSVEMAVTLGECDQSGVNKLDLQWVDGTREHIRWRPELEVMVGRCDIGEPEGILLYGRTGDRPLTTVVDASDTDTAQVKLG